jgi:aminoglycoside 2'-N-acetyltransferase I
MRAMTGLRLVTTSELTATETADVRDLLVRAFEDGDGFTDEDWQHALGGIHFLVKRIDTVLAHAAVVDRLLHVGDQPVRAGYVEAVGVEPGEQRTGLGTRVMTAVSEHIRRNFELGALGTGAHGFYERLGWHTWRGPSRVLMPDGTVASTPEDDGYLLVLDTPSSPTLDPKAPLTCAWRPGDVW